MGVTLGLVDTWNLMRTLDRMANVVAGLSKLNSGLGVHLINIYFIPQVVPSHHQVIISLIPLIHLLPSSLYAWKNKSLPRKRTTWHKRIWPGAD